MVKRKWYKPPKTNQERVWVCSLKHMVDTCDHLDKQTTAALLEREDLSQRASNVQVQTMTRTMGRTINCANNEMVVDLYHALSPCHQGEIDMGIGASTIKVEAITSVVDVVGPYRDMPARILSNPNTPVCREVRVNLICLK